MSEYEIHNLIMMSRAEFDIGTVVYIATGIALMCVVVLAKSNWSADTRRIITVVYLVVCGLIIIRIVASIVRFGKLNLILESMNPEFIVTNLYLQAPTLLLRIAVLILVPIATLRLVRQSS